MKKKIPVLDKRYRKHRALTPEEQLLWQSENTNEKLQAAEEKQPVQKTLKPVAIIALKAKKKKAAPVSPLLDTPTLTKLRKGALAVEATLDLHGHTQDSAYAMLQHFIARAVKKKLKLVLVITGKGKAQGSDGVLRRMLPRWLEETALRAHIIAYDKAHDKHGGSGAWYIRLKKTR